ncbi:hypothetical protein [Lactiplantibacillus plantarum]|uniref:hypothetical protein n=1 Tax=Lactiplantibacillus plantarum TaxID=1590 RepID=UPI001FB91AD6|nr:hypothetical protein [Lactiplantibacillus plantarum]MBO2729616.1 hypothetical protein [Lactiplantibacillus plantarum]
MTALESSWFEEAQQSMHGWDFSHLAGRWQTADLPWDYAALVREHLRTCLDTLTFDLILVKLDQKQEFLIHEKLCTPL